MNNNLTPAATVLILRDIKNVMEVLMVKRSKRPPFENLYVFPGGKIDQDDHLKDLENYCNALDDKNASKLLGLDSGGLSYWIACIRECFEEVGILLATKRSGKKLNLQDNQKSKFDEYRKRLANNEINFLDICIKEDLLLSTENIAPLSHWITPNIETRRFDTRFFIAFLPEGQKEKHDGLELTDSIWISPKAAIESAYSGKMQMIMPTIKNLEACMSFLSGKKMLKHQKQLSNKDFPPILPKFFKENGKWIGLLPGDKGYEDH
tara:strand:+ start:9516 stop:10307 length:792 start_codon:yes stop_codon:yes gene_type:complete